MLCELIVDMALGANFLPLQTFDIGIILWLVGSFVLCCKTSFSTKASSDNLKSTPHSTVCITLSLIGIKFFDGDTSKCNVGEKSKVAVCVPDCIRWFQDIIPYVAEYHRLMNYFQLSLVAMIDHCNYIK